MRTRCWETAAGAWHLGGPVSEPLSLCRARHRCRRFAVVSLALACALVLAGCGSRQSMFQSGSKQAHDIDLLWWWMLGAAGVVLFGSLALLVLGWFRRNARGLPFFGQREGVNEMLVLLFGVAIPAVVLIVLFGFSDVYLIGQTSPPDPKTTAMNLHVVGHQWWWEIKYPGTDVVTANEIHLPVNTRVNVVVTTNDVIHSFWVPELQRKIDTIPGFRNRVMLDADRVGVYRGQCSQYCGFQHAHMAMRVFVQRPAAYRAWLRRQEKPARTPTTPMQKTGEAVFMTHQCESCHTIAGTPARGTIGPNLTHVGSRTTLAADTINNTPKELAAWIRNPQAIKPGADMPDLGLSHKQVSEVVAYLDSLK